MEYSLTCGCGKQLRVSAKMCGQDVTCTCGRIIQIPRLSELRKDAGLEPFQVSIQDRLREMALDGKLPIECECVVCGQQTQGKVDCLVECERPYVKGHGYLMSFILILLLPFWALRAVKRDYDNPEVHGDTLVVNVPIRICWSCRESRRLSRQTVTDLLRKTDLYGELLDAFPNADVQLRTKQK